MIAQKAQHTPKERVRVLQRKLSQAAKANPKRRFGILYDKVKSKDVIWEAWRRVSSKGGCAGVDGVSIKWVREVYGVERYLEEIREALENEWYRPDKIRRTYIGKADGGKRPLGIPTLTDRVVQAAVKLIIEPIFEADFQDCSYGFRPKRCQHQALAEVDKYLWRGCRWVVDLDFTKYFDTIPHDPLLKLVERRVSDPKVIRLIRWWLKAGVLEDGVVTYYDVGTPQGAVISPLLSNIYLNELDTEWTKRGYAKRWVANCHLIRFADDLVVLCPTEGKARFSYREIDEFARPMGITIHPEKSRVVYLRDGFDFLGFHYCQGYSSRLKKVVPVKIPRAKAMKNIRARVKEAIHRVPLDQDIKQVIVEVNPKLRGWANYFRVGCSHKASTRFANYACSQLRLFIRRKYNHKGSQWYRRFPNSYFYARGLHYVPKLLR